MWCGIKSTKTFSFAWSHFVYSVFQIFRQVVKDELAVLQQSENGWITQPTRIKYDTLLVAVFLFSIIFINSAKSFYQFVFFCFINKVIQSFFKFFGSFSRTIYICDSNSFIRFRKRLIVTPNSFI